MSMMPCKCGIGIMRVLKVLELCWGYVGERVRIVDKKVEKELNGKRG